MMGPGTAAADAACLLGGRRLALETAQDYVSTRKQFGKVSGGVSEYTVHRLATPTWSAPQGSMVLQAWAIDTDHRHRGAPWPSGWGPTPVSRSPTTPCSFTAAGYLKDYPLMDRARPAGPPHPRRHHEIMRVITAAGNFCRRHPKTTGRTTMKIASSAR
jgi:hypothetical protein